MNKSVSFCVKNQDGLISLIRILKIQPNGACYVDYDKKNNDYHFSLHPPTEKYSNGQMHIKQKGRIIFKREIPEFHDFNKNRIFESVLILETELRPPLVKIPESVIQLDLPKHHMIHIMFGRSKKDWGSVKSFFISDQPYKQDNETRLPYPVFYSIEDMPDTNYYLAYNIQPIDKNISIYIENEKLQYIKNNKMKIGDRHITHLRHPILATDIEISINPQIYNGKE